MVMAVVDEFVMSWLTLASICVVLFGCLVSGDSTISVPLPSSNCNQTFNVDGAHIYSSRNDTAGACDIKIHGLSWKLVVIFNYLTLECSQTIKIYNSAKGRDKLVKTFDCKSRSRDLDTEYIDNDDIIIIFDNPEGKENFNFSITVTSYTTEFTCGTGKTTCSLEGSNDDMCLDADLYCDHVKNCPDGRDENTCPENQPLWQRVIGGLVGIAILVGIGVLVWYCCTRPSAPIYRQRHPMAGVPMGGVSQTVVVQAPPAAAPAPAPAYYPTGMAAPPPGTQPMAPPPGMYQQPPPGSYPTQGPPPMAAPPLGGYQPVPSGPPVGQPAPYNPGYPPAKQ